MDGESSYESDISESWSLIDINSNEETLSANESPLESEKTNLVESKYLQTETSDDLTLKGCVDKCKEAQENDFNTLRGSDSNSSTLSEGFVHSCYEDIEAPSPSNKAKEDDGKNDSDIESIEILDVDGIYGESEIDRINDSHDSQTYQSDDEESVEENINNRSTSSTVIKRKRRKCPDNSEDAVNSVNRKDKRPEKNDSEVFVSESSEGDFSKALFEGSSHPVYKHHRNNVANAVLSLLVGIIFAGVACIAIGHFLGVQDAAENAGELVGSLKKLQVENAALQSRLFHLNRALLNREANSKSGPPPERSSCKENPGVLTSKSDGTDLNRAALSEIRASLNSVEWLSKIQNLVRNENKAPESGVDFKKFGMYIHDQLNYLKTKTKKEGGIKLLEDADRKISKVLEKIVTRLSTSQENIENLYDRLINLKDKLNHKLNKILPEAMEEVEESRKNFERSRPVTEYDLQALKWKSEECVRNCLGGHPEPVVLYQFPQPEKYYQVEVRNLEKVESEKIDVTNSTETSKSEKVEITEKKGKKRHKDESEKRKPKEGGKTNSKKSDWKETEGKSENKDKRQKRIAKKFNAKQTERSGNKKKKENRVLNSESVKLTFGPSFNKTESEKARRNKADEEVVKSKRKSKKFQKSKTKKSNLSKVKRDPYDRKKYNRLCLGFNCSNSTGYWVFKWAGGREEFRKLQKLGDWQFERAKTRKELRDEDYSVNWQFKRALGRESNRHGGRWSHGKHTRFNGKELFHDRFSWI